MVLSLSSLPGIYLLASPTLQLHILFFFLSDDGDALEKHFSAITTVHTWIRWFFKTLKRDPQRERLDHIITYSNGTEEAPCTSLLTWSISWGSTLPPINNILVPSLLHHCSSCLYCMWFSLTNNVCRADDDWRWIEISGRIGA